MRSDWLRKERPQLIDLTGKQGARIGALTALSSVRKVRNSVGAIAQLGERLHGMQEVGGSIPPSSTKSYR